MTNRLDDTQRKQLNSIVSDCRRILAEDLGALLEGLYGIRPDGTVEPIRSLRLTDAEAETRTDLEGILDHFEAEDGRGRTGRDRLLREAVFTHVNRLLAIRIAEQLQLLPESIAQGRSSRGFRDLVADVAPLLAADDTGGYWTYLCLCGDELAADAPTLFDPRNPLLALAPSPSALDALIDLLRTAPAPIWEAADTLGWAYQFFNTTDERREMREGGAPLNSRELAVRNQFFTPDYVVSYLVHNSLGRRLLDADPNSPLVDDLDWLVEAPTERGEPLDLIDVKVLDPACGSGHFLLGAYDVLERAWHHRGVNAADAAPLIVPTLWGIDIDSRAAQVAAAAVILRARRACGRMARLPRPNVICARVLPPVPSDELAALPSSHRQILAELREELDRAPTLGSLLKLESVLGMERTAGTARAAKKGMAPIPIDSNATSEVDAVRREVIEVVQRAADQISSTAVERLTAVEADDALRFVSAITQRYDTVLMNPPFGEPVKGTRAYIKTAYPWIPTMDHNLFAAFVGRGIELCNANGYVGAITSRAGMFLSTFGRWRSEVVLRHQLVTLADLGFGVMEQALVEAAAYVIGARRSEPSDHCTFLRMLREPAPVRKSALHNAVGAHRAGDRDARVFSVATNSFDVIAGSPMAYWISPSIRDLFDHLPSLAGGGREVRVGLQTGDDFRFVRAFWEVDPSTVGRSRTETMFGKRWIPFAKGGEYAPFWADIHLVVEYERDGERLREYEGSVLRNPQFYFEAGITWPLRTASGFSPRVLPAGCAFSNKGPAVLPSGSVESVLAWMTSRLAGALVAVQLGAADETSSGSASKSYEVGLVSKIPWPAGLEAVDGLAERVREFAEAVRLTDLVDETTRLFRGPAVATFQGVDALSEQTLRSDEDRALALIALSSTIEAEIYSVVGHDVKGFVEEEMGIHPDDLPADESVATDLVDAYNSTTEKLITEGVARRGGLKSLTQKTFVADRRLEILAHTYEVHPSVIVSRRRQEELRPAGCDRRIAEELLSYLVGCSFGRWDVRIGRDPSLAPPIPGLFDAVPVCPPAMLVGIDGMPARQAPDDYPITLPPHRLLFDEAGHRYDMIAGLEASTAELVDSPIEMLQEVERFLGRDLRDHLRRQFFKDHLGRYSKSRRKAPIYWPLYVPSRQWGVWVYAPTLNRETLFAIEAAADQRLGSAIAETRRLESQQLEAGGRTTRELAQELERERKLAEELRLFHREARRIAELGWEPDLDDGIILCATPLIELFPDWKVDLVAARKDLKRGDYDGWASVARFKAAL